MCVKDEGTLKELPLQNLSYLNKNVPVSIWTFSLKKQKMVPKKKTLTREVRSRTCRADLQSQKKRKEEVKELHGAVIVCKPHTADPGDDL